MRVPHGILRSRSTGRSELSSSYFVLHASCIECLLFKSTRILFILTTIAITVSYN